MYQNSIFPLRTIVGNAIPIGKNSIRKVFESKESGALAMQYDFNLKASIVDTKTDPHYAHYLPTFVINGTTISPGEGMDTLPLPSNPRPFGNDAQVISCFALSKKKATKDVSRKLSARFTLQLPDNFLVGGICFGGFPYLFCSQLQTLSQGVNSANFGLPREVRLTCAGAKTADPKDTSLSFEFLDSDISATKQEIVSNSGFHFLCIDPTLTNVLTVHFSDYPIILTKAEFDTVAKKLSVTEHYGFIIPYFSIFEYKEKTRYRPIVSTGLLGTTTNNSVEKHPFANSIDYKHVTPRSGKTNYFDFTAASIFGQQRTYTIRNEVYDGKKPKGKVKEEFKECFISLKVKPEKNVVLYIEQGEEYERCVAGLKIFLPFIPEVALKEDVEQISAGIKEFYPDSPDIATLIENAPREDLEKALRRFLKIPKDIDFCEKIGIRVYEIDPPEGVSPLEVPLESKYATLLAEKEIDQLPEISLALFLEGVKFVRPSNSRFFAIELTNLDDKPGQFVVKGMKLVQSAHVSVHPRAARSQQVRTLNFRIIGPNLAEDYALLGNEGFNFSIERFVAGERKNVLFRANSLMDLLHTGAAKIFSNARRRAIEFEKSEIYPAFENDSFKYLVPGEFDVDVGVKFKPNYEKRYSESKLEGWRRSETGHDVEGKTDWKGIKQPGEFENFGNQELRTHTKHIYPRLRDDAGNRTPFSFMRGWFNGLKGELITSGISDNEDLIPNPGASPLTAGFEDIWLGLVVPPIMGLKQLSSSPYGLIQFSKLNKFLKNPNPEDLLDLIANHANPHALPLVGGISGSVNYNAGVSLVFASLGFGASLGVNWFPMLYHQATFGDQGLITKQASKSGYSYSQFLNNSYDEGKGYTEIEGGEMKRVITRKEVPNTDRQRVKGAEVMWQGELSDIITGSIPLNFTLPATAGKMHFRTSDDSLRVRFGSGVGKSISVDFWFDLTEEVIRDDN